MIIGNAVAILSNARHHLIEQAVNLSPQSREYLDIMSATLLLTMFCNIAQVAERTRSRRYL